MTYDGTTVTAYLNGTSIGTNTTVSGNIAYSSNNVNIGADNDGLEYFPGSIDEVHIYNKALSAADISQQYNGGAGLYGILPDPNLSGATLIGGWHFDEGSGTSVTDYSGNGHTGTLVNSPTWVAGKVPGAGVGGLMNGTNGAEFDGSAGDGAGQPVGTGDVNGDGYADILVGAMTRNSNTGGGYVVFGKTTGWSSTTALSTLTGANGFRIDATTAGSFSGTGFNAGNFNGDGFADIIIGSANSAPGGVTNAGSAFLILGRGTWSRANYTLDNNGTTGLINGTTGIELDGTIASGLAGASNVVGDINGDGLGDAIIGAYGVDGTEGGAVYVYFGRSSGFTSPVTLTGL